MAIGQAGSITTNSPGVNTPITINLTQPLTDPVFALSATNNGGNQFTLRVTDQTLDADGNTTSFSFIIEEWEYHDGAHPATETINWIAVEEGVHTLPDGRIIEAGRTTTDGVGADSNVNFAGDFSSDVGGFPSGAPVVLTSVMSNNDTTTVDSDPTGISTSGFNISLQEEEAEDDDHSDETIGWIAIQTGGNATSGTANIYDGVDENTDTLGLGATFGTSIVVGETQTINGGDTATVVIDGQTNSTVGLFIEEEQSDDNETNHINETVAVVAFEEGLIPCFTTGAMILTTTGPRRVETLSVGDMIPTVDNGPQPIRWICKRKLNHTDLISSPNYRPVIIRKDAIAPGWPDRDISVSAQHRMLITGWKAELLFGADEILVPARGLLDDQKVLVDHQAESVTYFHILFDRHEVIYANALPTESLHAGQLSKGLVPDAAREELFSLFPGLRCFETNFGPTARPTTTVRESGLLI
ncbi:Hint domain-containing protein [Cochlodiniinecator piscidefendens]|uniref:Hint domain-containing protein n=1 Tax=Cochlodiniinecator piscidefendens TaxID=2715756 RepID=UPI0014077064|nr:Hint domain-containing protein [Cochlodiniinecator piscidefendens]